METLLDFNAAEIFHALAITVIVILAVWEAGKKLFSILTGYYERRKKHDKHVNTINKLSESDKIQGETLDLLVGAVKVQMRHSIVRIAEEALKKGIIGAYELQSLEELFETYCNDLHGNSYVHDLMDKVRKLPIDYTNGRPVKH